MLDCPPRTVLPVGIDHQETELLLLHAGGAEGLHEVGLPHGGVGKDAHVLGQHLAVDDRDISQNPRPGPHDTDFDISHDFGQEHKVLRFG